MTYPGNRTDDTTHIETWNTLRRIQPDPNFLYVADCKLCTDEQLNHIVSHQGRAITMMPETWSEVKSFKASLRKGRKSKKEIWRRFKGGSDTVKEYFSAFTGKYFTEKRGYRIHWIYSSEKRQRDRASRQKRLRRAEETLTALGGKINMRKLKTSKSIQQAIDAILTSYRVEPFYHVDIGRAREETRRQIGRGRPGKNTQYKRVVKHVYTLGWSRNTIRLAQEAHTDGVFPLLSTDTELTSKEVLQAYKYQPRLEKRFQQFKHIHHGAPLLFKKLERIEATMFAFFIALMIQALIERLTRSIKVICAWAQVKYFTPHDLRRSCITNWAKKLPIQTVQYLAGHSNIATTRKYYLSVQKSEMKTARDIQSELLAKLTNF